MNVEDRNDGLAELCDRAEQVSPSVRIHGVSESRGKCMNSNNQCSKTCFHGEFTILRSEDFMSVEVEDILIC